MGRFRALVALTAIVAAGCGGGSSEPVETGASTSTSPAATSSTGPPSTATSPTNSSPPGSTASTPTEPVEGVDDAPPEGPLPDLLVANGTRVDFVQTTIDRDVKVSPLLTTGHPVSGLRQASDGSIFTEEYRTAGVGDDEGEATVVHEVRRYVDGVPTLVPRAVGLFDVAVVNGVESVIVAVPPADGFGFGGITARSVADPSVVVAEFGLAAEAEFFPVSADFAGGLLVVSAYADLTEWIGFVRPNGEEVALPSPTDDIPYAEPPLVVAAAFSRDGTELFWAEGPDWGFIDDEEGDGGESGPIPARWVLRSADAATGAERLYWPIGEEVLDTTELSVDSLHDFGTHLLANRSRLAGTEPELLGAWIVDFTTEEPDDWVLPVPGVAAPAVVAP